MFGSPPPGGQTSYARDGIDTWLQKRRDETGGHGAYGAAAVRIQRHLQGHEPDALPVDDPAPTRRGHGRKTKAE